MEPTDSKGEVIMEPGKKYKFKTVKDLLEMVHELGHSDNEKPAPICDISRTPLESVYPGSINYKGADYVSVGFGGDANTPWGLLPEIILLVRQDIASKLEEE